MQGLFQLQTNIYNGLRGVLETEEKMATVN